MTVMDYEDPALPEPLPDSEQAEAMAHDALVYELSCALMRLDGKDGDPHHLLWTGGTVPEPWGDAWQQYERQAEDVLNAIGDASAHALVQALSERDWVAEVVSSGPHNFPLLQWHSADVSLGTAIGTKLYLHPLAAAGVLAQPTGKTTDADGVPVGRTDLEWLRLPEILAKFTDYAQDPTDANALRIIRAAAERNAGVDLPDAGPAVVTLNEEQWQHFMDTMNNPAEPTEALKQGVKLLEELRAARGVQEVDRG